MIQTTKPNLGLLGLSGRPQNRLPSFDQSIVLSQGFLLKSSGQSEHSLGWAIH